MTRLLPIEHCIDCKYYDGGHLNYCMHPEIGSYTMDIDPYKEIPDTCPLNHLGSQTEFMDEKIVGYAITVMAFREGLCSTATAVTPSCNKEREGAAFVFSKKLWPLKDGWAHHHVSVYPISFNHLDQKAVCQCCTERKHNDH